METAITGIGVIVLLAILFILIAIFSALIFGRGSEKHKDSKRNHPSGLIGIFDETLKAENSPDSKRTRDSIRKKRNAFGQSA